MRLICNLLALLQLLAHSQCSHVQDAKRHIRAELRDVLGHGSPHSFEKHHYHGSHWHSGQRVHRLHMPQQRWSGRKRSFNHHTHPFSRWTQWTACGADCLRTRERYCKTKRRCGHTKHMEQRKCWHCHPQGDVHKPQAWQSNDNQNHNPSIIINAAAAAASGPPLAAHTTHAPPDFKLVHRPPQHHPPYINEDEDDEVEDEPIIDSSEQGDFFVLKQRRRIKKQQHRARKRPYKFQDDDYEDFFERARSNKALRARNLDVAENSDMEGDVFQYEDFDFEPDNLYADSDSEEYSEYRNSSNKERNTPDGLLQRHRRVYSKWSRWTKCSPKCTTRRYKKCRISEQCGREVLREIAYCYTEGSFCQQWLQAQVQKAPAYETRPGAVSAMRRMHSEPASNNAVMRDFIMNGKGYRGPEYVPPKLRCGLAPVRSGRRNMYNMLKIIGGKAARKGEWPWQVAIFNRFKEAFCGGTLIAPNWVLTAAHCVRKVLYVRVGEHNLDYEDGTEVQLRVLRSYKHPNFDKRTVDSDVALLRLPKPVNASTWIGYSCMPRPYQPLPKNMDCTVIGWGKRRNRDVAGTSVLHQADVPIIPMDTCRSVYHDYTITKNMLCAGHRRGRIDTCAGDSGGPLLCRDTTKPNHPWTIFGITSFGDGCAKRNKFGIYAKVPNYVDWVWSVVNCNGNCKLNQRGSDGS